CNGLGEVELFDPRKVVGFPELSLAAGAIHGWDRRNAFTYTMLTSLAAHYQFDIDTPFQDLPEQVRNSVLYGSGTENISFFYIGDKGSTTVKSHPFEGVIPNLQRRWEQTESTAVREELSKLRHTMPCTECKGARLKQEARHVFIGSS